MDRLTDAQVAEFLAGFSNYRVLRTQKVAASTGVAADGVVWLALGLRETFLKNVEGGAKWDEHLARWVKEDDPNRMDVGCFQISRLHNGNALAMMRPAVRVGTWDEYDSDHTADDGGWCPRYEESVQYMAASFTSTRKYATSVGIPTSKRLNFVIAAHNAGRAGALSGYREGDVEKHTAGGDYVTWVRDTMEQVEDWLDAHPGWHYSP